MCAPIANGSPEKKKQKNNKNIRKLNLAHVSLIRWVGGRTEETTTGEVVRRQTTEEKGKNSNNGYRSLKERKRLPSPSLENVEEKRKRRESLANQVTPSVIVTNFLDGLVFLMSSSDRLGPLWTSVRNRSTQTRGTNKSPVQRTRRRLFLDATADTRDG